MTYTPACWFPSLVHILETEPNEEIKTKCLQARADNPKGVWRSNNGGWQSDSHDVWGMPWEESETGTVKSPHLTNYGSERLIKQHLHSLFEKSIDTVITGQLELFNYWVNINGKGAYNVRHDHPQAHFSGVYYVQCPENSGEIIFENPHGFTAFDELSCYKPEFIEQTIQHKSVSIKPVEGLLLMFPAYLQHAVAVNQSDQERISIGFNCIVHPEDPSQYYYDPTGREAGFK